MSDQDNTVTTLDSIELERVEHTVEDPIIPSGGDKDD